MKTIIQNSYILQYYNFQNIDEIVISEIEKNNSVLQRKTTFIRLLKAFLFVSENDLKFLDLSSNKFRFIIDNFYLFLNDQYINLSSSFLKNIKYDLLKLVDLLKANIQFIKDLEKAKVKLKPQIFKDIIYEK